MSTQNIPIVGVSVGQASRVSTRDMEKEEERKQRIVSQRLEIAQDSFENLEQTGKMSAAAEGLPPKAGKQQGAHSSLKEARSRLLKVIKETGKKIQSKDVEGEKLSAMAEQMIEKTEEDIVSLRQKGRGGSDLARLESMRDELYSARDAYHAALSDATSSTASLEEASVSQASPQAQMSTGEKNLWDEAKNLLEVDEIQEKDVEKLQKLVSAKLGKDMKDLKAQEKDLTTEAKSISEELKTASLDQKDKLQKDLEKVQKSLGEVMAKQKALSQKSQQAHGLVDKLVALQTKKDLGIEDISVIQPGVGEKIKEDQSPDAGKNLRTTTAALSIKSASDTSAPRAESTHTAGAMLRVESQHESTDHSTSLLTVANDVSGTTLAIASTGDTLRSNAKKTDKILKQLLQAALSGNWEAIKTALILLDKRASQITIGMGAQTIKAMQFYEKQMNALSDTLGKIKQQGNPEFQSKLAQINSQMNIYSMNRQAIANFLRDTLTMREEVANLTHSVLQKDSQIVSSVSR